MYTMDDHAVSDLVTGLEHIVRAAQTLIDHPRDSHYKLEDIVKSAQVQLERIRSGEYTTKPSQREEKIDLD